jgi:hypothetical protein
MVDAIRAAQAEPRAEMTANHLKVGGWRPEKNSAWRRHQ